MMTENMLLASSLLLKHKEPSPTPEKTYLQLRTSKSVLVLKRHPQQCMQFTQNKTSLYYNVLRSFSANNPTQTPLELFVTLSPYPLPGPFSFFNKPRWFFPLSYLPLLFILPGAILPLVFFWLAPLTTGVSAPLSLHPKLFLIVPP